MFISCLQHALESHGIGMPPIAVPPRYPVPAAGLLPQTYPQLVYSPLDNQANSLKQDLPPMYSQMRDIQQQQQTLHQQLHSQLQSQYQQQDLPHQHQSNQKQMDDKSNLMQEFQPLPHSTQTYPQQTVPHLQLLSQAYQQSVESASTQRALHQNQNALSTSE